MKQLKEYKYLTKGAPIAFTGNKRNTLKYIYKLLEELQNQGFYLDKDTIIVDVFGGSGLLANFFKELYPNNTVIYNDFDNYLARIAKLEATDEKLAELIEEIKKKHQKIEKNIKLLPEVKEYLYKEIDKLDENIYDIHKIISIFSLFGIVKQRKKTGKYVITGININENWGNSSKRFNLETYLKGVITERLDFRDLLDKYNEEKYPKILYIVDPPYIETDCSHYKGGFTKELHEIFIKKLKEMTNFIYFNMDSTSAGKEAKEMFDNKEDIKKVEFISTRKYLIYRNPVEDSKELMYFKVTDNILIKDETEQLKLI